MSAGSGRRPTLESVVAEFYEAAMAPDLWPEALDQMSDLLGGTSFVFGYHDDRGLAFGATNRLDPDHQKRLLRDYVSTDTNPLLAAMPRLPVLASVPRVQLIPDEQYLRTGLYNDVFRPQKLTHVAIACLRRGGGAMITCGLLRQTRKELSSASMTAFDRLMPHLRRTVDLTVRTLQMSVVQSAARAAGDASADVFVVVDDTRRVILCNEGGEKALEDADGICCLNGRLCLTQATPRVVERFDDLVRSAAHRTGDRGGDLRIPRDEIGAAWAALVMPVPHRTGDLIVRPPAAALVRLVDLEAKLSVPKSRLVIIYGLTEAEATLAVELLRGAQPEDVAQRRGLKVSTIRTQLRSIFAKTGTHRQSELMRLLSCLAGPQT
jgi:DNA-binding CsgD family transcriptional regulator